MENLTIFARLYEICTITNSNHASIVLYYCVSQYFFPTGWRIATEQYVYSQNLTASFLQNSISSSIGVLPSILCFKREFTYINKTKQRTRLRWSCLIAWRFIITTTWYFLHFKSVRLFENWKQEFLKATTLSYSITRGKFNDDKHVIVTQLHNSTLVSVLWLVICKWYTKDHKSNSAPRWLDSLVGRALHRYGRTTANSVCFTKNWVKIGAKIGKNCH